MKRRKKEERALGSVLEELHAYVFAIKHGADPIEALSGHLCGPKCMHWDVLSEERKRELMKAPWNQDERSR